MVLLCGQVIEKWRYRRMVGGRGGGGSSPANFAGAAEGLFQLQRGDHDRYCPFHGAVDLFRITEQVAQNTAALTTLRI